MNEVPHGWAPVALGEVSAPRGEKADPSDLDDLPFIGLEEVEAHTGRVIRMQTIAGLKSAVVLFGKGDLLYGRLRPYLNKVVLAEGRGAASAEFIVLPPSEALDQRYLQRTLMSPGFVQFAGLRSTGDRPRVSFEGIADYQFPLPPLSEQRRIVAKIDSLTGKSKRARDHLDHIPRLVEKYKQAILAAAFRGDLTREWRAKNKIDAGKRVADNSIPDSSSATKARARKTAALTPDQIAGMWDGPAGWRWSQVGSCAFVTKLAGFEYTKHVKYETSGNLRVIKAENAGPRGFRETDYSRVSSDAVAVLSRSRLVGGELLVVFVGAGTGNVAVVPQADDFFLGPNIGMVRPAPDAAESRYLELFFRSDKGRELLLVTSKAVAQPSLSMGAIRSTPVLLPPLAEQAEIVHCIDNAFAWIDRLAAETASARRLIDRLDQALLAKAFRGELVPQDPADEPASVLLERIRAERATVPKSRRGRRPRVA